MKLIRIDGSNIQKRIPIYRLDFHPDLVEVFADSGIVEIKDGYISSADLKRIYKVTRLRRSLGVNLVGASIIVELMERMEELEEENKKIREKMQGEEDE